MTIQDDGATPTGTLPEDFTRQLDLGRPQPARNAVEVAEVLKERAKVRSVKDEVDIYPLSFRLHPSGEP